MQELFAALTRAVEGSAFVALGASLVWGVLSMVLSPCHLASIPLIVGFIGQQGQTGARRAFAISGLFATGILMTIGVIGVLTAAAGRMMGDVGIWGNIFVAGLFFVVGLYLMDVITLSWSGFTPSTSLARGWKGAILLGLLFGIGLGPCTFGFMAPVLGVVFSVAATNLLQAITLLAAFGIGHCSVLVLAGGTAGTVQKYLNWTERTKGATYLKRVAGALVLLAGVYYVYTVL